MTTVLAGIDNSAAAGPVLTAAKAAAALLRGRATAVHVRENGMEAARAAARAAGVELVPARGPTRECLVDSARRSEVALLVLGARGTPGGQRPAGRTALDVVSAVAKPVLVVPPDARLEHVARMLVPLDGTMASATTLASTIRFARKSRIEVIALHVHQPETLPAFEDHPHHEREAWAREFVGRYCDLPLDEVRLEVRVGSPAREVVQVARDLDVDVITLGWRRRLGSDRAAVVREALAHSPVPVLLVPILTEAASEGRETIAGSLETRA
jgi:nucleotide-binding universal stress UspA family protein